MIVSDVFLNFIKERYMRECVEQGIHWTFSRSTFKLVLLSSFYLSKYLQFFVRRYFSEVKNENK